MEMERSVRDSDPVVEDDEAAERLVVREGDDVAELRYHRRGDRLSILHTEVPTPLEGKGIGSALVRAAVGIAAAEGLTLVPYCPFARRWLHDHPDVAASVVIDDP